MSEGTAIVWFRRDLRLTDNPALAAAVDSCKLIIPVYIYAPAEEFPWCSGSASNWWLQQSLIALQQQLLKMGSQLRIYQGGSQANLLRLVAEYNVSEVYWNRVYESSFLCRDLAIKQNLEEQGVACCSFNASLLNEPGAILTGRGTPYRVFGAYWRNCAVDLHQAVQPLALPDCIATPRTEDAAVDIDALGLMPSIPWYRGFEKVWNPGEAGAQQRVERALERAIPGYDESRNIPAIEGTSRLSPHLHFGEISPRQILWELLTRFGHTASLEPHLTRFITELGWREFSHYLLYHFPESANRSLDERFEQAGWFSDDRTQQALLAWQQGTTGIPIVDAGMRELWHTGWMHNRVRMIVASLLTKNLGVHWLQGARWFWDTLVDADLANNTMGWQWTAGCGADAAPYFRVFNPARQAARFDAAGEYIRRWVPELAHAGTKALYNGSTELSDSEKYPPPLVDLADTRKLALERWDMIKTVKTAEG